ncbi:MAG: biotin/lipoate A/B protein ligase family protein [Desulfobacteraceae bacterium]|jgi:lipoate-protein ligase A
MTPWRLLDTPPMTAADNMALDETLLELKGQGRTPNTIRFLQFNPRAVLVGYHQSVQEEIRLEYVKENGIEVNRRITGGGAIFFDENQLGWEVYCNKQFFDIVIPNHRLFKTLCQPVAIALDRLGLDAEFRPRNDIEVNGRKISGTGGTESEGAFMFQGTMLVDFDVDTMLRALRIPVEKLKAKEIDSIKDRVTCLNWELGCTPSLDDIKSAIWYGFEKHLGIQLKPGGLTSQEQELFERKRDRYRSREWIDRVKPRFQRREAVQSSYKSDAGMVRYTLVVNLAQRRLKDIYITGDFLSFPGRALYDLESILRGMPLDNGQLIQTIDRFFDQGRITIPGMTVADFVQPLMQALEKIEITKFGIPLEHANLISVTNGSFEEILRKDPSVLLLPYCAKGTDCELRYAKGCKTCGQEQCTIGPAWSMGVRRKMRVVTVTSFEDLWAELNHMKARGVKAYIGCCCQPFYAKHVDDFRRSRMPGILLDIDNTTCYDLDQAKAAYAGSFESQTELNLDLLETVLAAGAKINSKGLVKS